MIHRSALVLAVAILLAASASAQLAFQPGDVIVSGYSVAANPATLDARMAIYDAHGQFQRFLLPRTPLGIGEPEFDGFGRLFVPISGRLAIVSPAGAVQSEVYGHGCCIEFFALDKVATAFGLFGGGGAGINEVHPDGTLRYFDVADLHVMGDDLASDQCTLFVSGYKDVNQHSVGHIAAVNVCDPARPVTRMFQLPVPYPGPVRVLPDGDLLVGSHPGLSGPDDRLVKVSPTGTVHALFPIRATAIAVDPSGTSAWIVTPAGISKIALDSGATLLGPIPSPFDYAIEGIAVRGEARAAIPPLNVPALDPRGVAILALALIAVALLVRPR
jgi:hypothetical protein